jgi:hypothetical protein
VTFLPPEALHFRHRHPLDAQLRERFLHFFEFERLDDGFEFFHGLRDVGADRDSDRTSARKSEIDATAQAPICDKFCFALNERNASVFSAVAG